MAFFFFFFFINSLIFLISILSLFILFRLFIYRTPLIHLFRTCFRYIDQKIHAHQFFKVPEVNENGQQNHLFKKVNLYLNSFSSLEDSDFTNLFSCNNSSTDILLSLDDNQAVPDKFLGARISWVNKKESHGQRSFLLKLKRKDKKRILKPYLQHILSVVEGMNTKELKFFINDFTQNDQENIGRWKSFPFRHPATMETMIMDVDLKNKVKYDLELFLKSKQHYQKLGRIWKRNYLLYGPPGTGKSSFIAAMANFLNYDVYDVDLNRVLDDSDLKLLHVEINSKSLIVVEDLDRFICMREKSGSRNGVSLSGLLNFMDGMNNGDEKIMIFTMNNKDEIDPMVLRPGRIDVHIYFPLCDFNSFKSLAHSYLGVREHKLFPHVEEIIMSGAKISPAEISELMVANRNSPSRALKTVITALQSNLNGGGGRLERRMFDSAASSPAISYTEENGVGGWKEGVPGLRKLYGMLKSKSSNKSGVFDCVSPMMER